jgi:transcriptional regulator with XRE-family HTH domain
MRAEWFAGRLKELREQAGLTQRQLGEQAGVSERAVAQWERGVREPVWSNVIALCQALGVSCEAFTQEPAPREGAGPGRPPKRAGGVPAEEQPKRPRGRPPKRAGGEQTAAPKKRRGRRPKDGTGKGGAAH